MREQIEVMRQRERDERASLLAEMARRDAEHSAAVTARVDEIRQMELEFQKAADAARSALQHRQVELSTIEIQHEAFMRRAGARLDELGNDCVRAAMLECKVGAAQLNGARTWLEDHPRFGLWTVKETTPDDVRLALNRIAECETALPALLTSSLSRDEIEAEVQRLVGCDVSTTREKLVRETFDSLKRTSVQSTPRAQR